jgi:hypothetical protein
MALAISITSIMATGAQLRVAFNITASGTYTTAVGGDTLNFTTATQDAAYQGMVAQIESGAAPVSLDIWDAGGNLANGLFPVLGTTQANCKLKFTSAFNTELGTGAYPGAITGTKLQGEAVFVKNV